jgi:hypothetical protein
MNSQLFEQMSSLTYSDFSAKTIKENFSLVEGYTYFDTTSSTNTATLRGNTSLKEYTDLRDRLTKDSKYDFNGNILNFHDSNYLISEQIKRDNEMLINSEDNLKVASYIAATTMFIVAFIIIGSKQ